MNPAEQATPGVPGDPALSLEDVSFAWPGPVGVFNGLDLAVPAGEGVALLGANGTGKTTLLLLAAGCLWPAAGRIRVDGLAVTPAGLREARRRLGFVFQEADDQLFMPTVLEDVAFGPLAAGMAREAARTRAEDTLSRLEAAGLAHRPPHRLSGGEKRRAALATALALEPALLLLDEPTAGLDARGRAGLARLLRGLPPARLVATHNLEFAEATCVRAVVLEKGRVAADGPIGAVLGDGGLLRRAGLIV